MQGKSYFLSNGQSVRFGEGKLWLTRNAGFSDAFKTLATLPFAVLSFVLTAASFRSCIEDISFSAFIGFLFGVAGLITTWFFFKYTMGAIAGLPNLVIERTASGVRLWGDVLAGEVEFVARFGSLGVRCEGDTIETLIVGLIPDEAGSLAERLNEVFFAQRDKLGSAQSSSVVGMEREAHSFGA